MNRLDEIDVDKAVEFVVSCMNFRSFINGYCYTNGYVLTLYQMFIVNSDFISFLCRVLLLNSCRVTVTIAHPSACTHKTVVHVQCCVYHGF